MTITAFKWGNTTITNPDADGGIQVDKITGSVWRRALSGKGRLHRIATSKRRVNLIWTNRSLSVRNEIAGALVTYGDTVAAVELPPDITLASAVGLSSSYSEKADFGGNSTPVYTIRLTFEEV